MAIASVNPATGEILKTFTALTEAEITAKLALAQQTFEKYRLTTFSQRSFWLNRAAEILNQDKQRLASIITMEMGKPLQSAISEVEKCAVVCRFYAEQGEGFLADEVISSDADHSYVSYQPLGAILAVMPWNFPFWQVFRFAAPALMAGNVGLLKHASNVPQCALAIEEILNRAGFPLGAFQSLLIGANQVQSLIRDDRVKAATLTGSEPAGAALAAEAGKQIKKVVLELGGSDPFIVLESADISAAVATAVQARMLNNGQSCIAAKRLIVVETIADDFTTQLLERFKNLKIGDPRQESTDIGPLATSSIRQELVNQVGAALEQGATLLLGEHPFQERPGNFYPPTILTDIPTGAPIAQEEFFGPVALIFKVANLEQAIALANDIPFGLGASVWSKNPEEIARLIRDIDAGAVFVNGMVKSDPCLPFGGIKRSGFGRELGRQGLLEFMNLKTVWIKQ